MSSSTTAIATTATTTFHARFIDAIDRLLTSPSPTIGDGGERLSRQ